MSHYSLVETKIKRKSALIKALQKMGFKSHMIEHSDVLMPLKGYGGDIRSQKANIRIKGAGWGHSNNYVGSASNDLGFQKMNDGTYAFHVSDYDKSKYNKGWQQQLIQYYGAETVKEIAIENNFFVESEVKENGEIFIEVNSPF